MFKPSRLILIAFALGLMAAVQGCPLEPIELESLF